MNRSGPASTAKPIQIRLYRLVPYLVGFLIFGLMPFFLPTNIKGMMTQVLIFAIFAMSLDIIFGYTGLLSFGHAAYFAIGGYTVAILVTRFGIESFWILAICGILTATIAAAFFGYIALRVTGIYFMLVTFALGQLVFSVVWTSVWLTGGDNGMPNIPYPNLGIAAIHWNNTNFYYFIFVIFIICFFIMLRIVQSPFGNALEGIRENEGRMRALGYNIWLNQYIAFIIAGLFAGVAGMLFAQYNGFMSPNQANFLTSALVWLYVIIGGAGSLWGPVIGTAITVFIQYYASLYFPERWPFILGSIFIIAVIFLRGGIAPQLIKFWRRVYLWNP